MEVSAPSSVLQLVASTPTLSKASFLHSLMYIRNCTVMDCILHRTSVTLMCTLWPSKIENTCAYAQNKRCNTI